MYDPFENFTLQAEVLECNNQTLTVKGIPFWFEFIPNKWILAGTDITITEYMGTEDIGMLYLNKPVNIEVGKHINITYK